MSRPVRALVFSTLYPSSARPLHGIFVETRLRELLKRGDVEARVVAPVPWFPSEHPRYGEKAAIARTPPQEVRHDIEVKHPRYLVIPKVGMHLAPLLLAMGARASLQSHIDKGFDFDLIDAHYMYPDGVAAALLARWFQRPFVLTARGSDINLIAEFQLPRKMIRWAVNGAAASIGVSDSLAVRIRSLVGSEPRVLVARNGVDTERFRPESQVEARQRLGVGGAPLLLTVGNLLQVKGHHLVIDALALMRRDHPDARLAVVGDGPLRSELEQQAAKLNLNEAVRFVGPVAQEDLRWWYSAADLLVLASQREGWPNVLLEAMACGTRVVASRVGGVPEIITAPALGAAVPIDSPAALSAALVAVLAQPADKAAVRQHAMRLGWASTAESLAQLFQSVAANPGASVRNRYVETP